MSHGETRVAQVKVEVRRLLMNRHEVTVSRSHT